MSKRDYGSGGIRQKDTGKWEASIRANGRRVYRVFATKREAQAWLTKAGAEAQAGTLAVPERITLADYGARWLAAVEPRLRRSTWMGYGAMMGHMVERLGSVRLDQLTPLAIQQAEAELLASGLGSATVNAAHGVLRRALAQAVRWQMLARNPTDGVTPPVPKRKTMQTWTPDEVRRFLLAARGDRLFAFYVLALTTGMRRGELLGLWWEDIDWAGRALVVRRQLTQGAGDKMLSEPKTAQARRRVVLTPAALTALAQHRDEQAAEGYVQQFVFVTSSGKTYWPAHIRPVFRHLCQRAGVPVIRIHDLRHTAATLLLGYGVNPKVVSEMLGHGDVSMTLDVYSHVLPTMQEAAAAAMQAGIGAALDA